MAEFSAEVFQNEFLSDGATDVHAVVSVTCTGAGAAGTASPAGPGGAAEIVAVDTSGSMQGRNMEAAKHAAAVAVDQIPDGTLFAIVGGSHVATRIFPYPNARVPMVAMEPGARAEAKRAIATMSASGGTAISTWLRLADELFATAPVANKHLILLTDGKNESEPSAHLDQMIANVTGRFQCDARGVGDRWVVGELRKISTALLGTVDLIARPEDIAEDFAALVRKSAARGVAAVDLRVWAPQGAQVLFVRQVAPEVDDLTARRTEVNPLTGGYPTGAWADETREYHVAVRVPAKVVGSEQLAARVQVAVDGEVAAAGLVKAKWSDDSTLTARISPEVAHYTGQAELASAIQEGLAAKAAGDEATATVKLGRAVQLAAETGNDEATSRLRKIVDVENEAEGTVRLRRNTAKLDEMALDTASTKTTRVRRS
ncbi:VWA domain-containing protein [Promicromonospora citrea]|uniref:VWA domain-containing protein n=1 Tax=Promicromonospora citrea TaxID=43677 RepID=A0A8H9GGX4_9MICO|nr:VWA domain-containing protein [Promicromonospora citrea]NNH54910.1 VWA domain-containing protein [Promicromonospora citrea]GGM26145.1 VWA domain-containing protein [Promicromonospora citrea]